MAEQTKPKFKLNPNATPYVPKAVPAEAPAQNAFPQPVMMPQAQPQYVYIDPQGIVYLYPTATTTITMEYTAYCEQIIKYNEMLEKNNKMLFRGFCEEDQKKEGKKKAEKTEKTQRNEEFQKLMQEKAKIAKEKREQEAKKAAERQKLMALNKKDEKAKEPGKDDAEEINDIVKEEEVKLEDNFVEIDEKMTPLSIVFIGHVDSGKSTICGRMLMDLGKVDLRVVEKYKKEAQEKNRESWWIAYVMDINEEEKQKGKTVEVGRVYFETPSKRITVFDAPGHSNYVPNMIMGASMADVGVLVISAKKGEFESGFAKGGQTTEHIILSRTIGIKKLIIVVNKMDEQSVKWDKGRFLEIKKELSPFLDSVGYFAENIDWIPISGLIGDNLCRPSEFLKWYDGPILIEALDKIDLGAPSLCPNVRVPIMDKLKDQGIDLFGKVIQGTIKIGSKLTLMPNKIPVEVTMIYNSEDDPIKYAPTGENIKFKLRGIDEESMVPRGSVLCSNDSLIPTFDTFEAEVNFLELPSKMLISEGFKCILHMHTIVEDCTVVKVRGVKLLGQKEFKPAKYVKSNTEASLILNTRIAICGEKYDDLKDMSRFTLRFDNRTIGFGKMMKYKK